MESATIETFLQRLGLERLITLFKDNDVDLETLLNSSDEDVKDLLTELNVTIGNRLKIINEIHKLKADGKYNMQNRNIFKKCIIDIYICTALAFKYNIN